MRPSPDDFRDAAEFIEAGADPEMIALELYGKVSIEAINLRAEALSNLEFHFDNRVAFISVNEEMCQRLGASAGDAKDLVSSVSCLSLTFEAAISDIPNSLAGFALLLSICFQNELSPIIWTVHFIWQESQEFQ